MRETYLYTKKLPDVIDVPHPYIGLGDLSDISKRFDSSISTEDTAQLQDELFGIQQVIVPHEASFIATSAKELASRLEAVAFYEVNRADTNVGVVILDRYIAQTTEHPSFFRLNVSRDKTGKQVARPGTQEAVSSQYDKMTQWRKDNDFEEVILMDDVLGVGTTLISTINELKKVLPHQKIRAFTGIATSGGEVWSGIEKVYKETGIMTEYLTRQQSSKQTQSSTGLSICNSRDMTMLGGYVQPGASNPRRSSPHFLPFTITVSKNFTDPYKRVIAADLLLGFNGIFIDFLEERMQQSLTMQDLTDKGFGHPVSNISAINGHFSEPSAGTLVKDHFTQARNIFVKHKQTIFEEVSLFTRRMQK